MVRTVLGWVRWLLLEAFVPPPDPHDKPVPEGHMTHDEFPFTGVY